MWSYINFEFQVVVVHDVEIIDAKGRIFFCETSMLVLYYILKLFVGNILNVIISNLLQACLNENHNEQIIKLGE